MYKICYIKEFIELIKVRLLHHMHSTELNGYNLLVLLFFNFAMEECYSYLIYTSQSGIILGFSHLVHLSCTPEFWIAEFNISIHYYLHLFF